MWVNNYFHNGQQIPFQDGFGVKYGGKICAGDTSSNHCLLTLGTPRKDPVVVFYGANRFMK